MACLLRIQGTEEPVKEPHMIRFTTSVELAKALRRAEAAHAVYEQQLGKRDDNWADWYARHIESEQNKG